MIKRTIGSIEGSERGPLLIVLGALHGNETAGVRAIDIVLKMLEVEPITNPGFALSGKIVGLIGNRRAYRKKERFIDVDLNRIWLEKSFDRIKSNAKSVLNSEEQELKELSQLIKKTINQYQPNRCILLDIHTTSSDGGLFVIPTDSEASIEIAKATNAPVIKGMLNGVKGTTLHYYSSERLNINIDAVTFEAGQHDDPLSINRSVAAVINVMRSIGMVSKEDVENIHDEVLIKYCHDLPKVTELIYKYSIQPGEEFVMNPGYKNFDIVKKDQALAMNQFGPVLSPFAGRILMPLYQKLGNDGFFIIQDLDDS